jgi:hypothetical protein
MDRHILTQTTHYAEGIRSRAQRLRTLADDLDCEADRVATIGTPEFRGGEFANNLGWIASQVQHHVIAALPNLRLEQLTTDAQQIDAQRGQS